MIIYKYIILSYKCVYALVFFRISADVPCVVLSAGLNNAITPYKESIYLRTTYFDDISLHLGIESLSP